MRYDCEKQQRFIYDIFLFTGRTTGVFPFGAAPPPYFMRNFMQAVAGHMVHGGITTTTISTRNPPATAVGAQQSAPTSMDSGSTNAGQSTQARYISDNTDDIILVLLYIQHRDIKKY